MRGHQGRKLLIGVLTAGSLLAAGGLPAVAQTPCALEPDAVVTQALGPSAHTQPGVATPGVDACTIVGSDSPSIGVVHVAGVFPSGQAADPLVLLQTVLQALPSDDSIDVEAGGQSATAGLEATPVTGVGDSALLLTQTTGAATLDNLLVQRGADAFSLTTSDSPDARARLIALAQAIVANLGR